jgi:hypothetical protein
MPMYFAYNRDDRPSGLTHFLAVVGPQTAWPGSATISKKDVSGGLDNTILLVQSRSAVPWLEPRDLSWDEMSFDVGDERGLSSPWGDPIVAMMASPQIWRLKSGTSTETVKDLLTIRGSKPDDLSTALKK